MIVTSYQDFVNKFGNDNIGQFDPIKNCITVLGKICACQKQRKAFKGEECNRVYINIVNTTVPTLVEYFKTKTLDEEITFFHNGSHLIRKIKLR
jgi:hypothetical protein